MTTTQFPFKAFVFEGGGSTAFGTYGALEVFHERGLIEQSKYYIGSSSGSFLAGALGCGIAVPDIRKILTETDFNKFLDDSHGCFRDIFRFFTKFGWHKGDYIENWYGNALAQYCGNSEITFKQAYEKTGKIAVIVTLDLTMGETIYQSYLTTPNLPIKKAVRRSISLPFIFKPDYAIEDIQIDDGTTVRNQRVKRAYIDGGIADNYPYEYVLNSFDHSEVVGFKLMASIELSAMTNPYVDYKNPTPPSSLKDMSLRTIIMLTNKNFKTHQNEKTWNMTIKIDTAKHSPTDFDLKDEDKAFMISQGRIASEKFLNEFLERTNKQSTYSVELIDRRISDSPEISSSDSDYSSDDTST